MIKKINILLVVFIAVIFAYKAFETLQAKIATSSEDASASVVEKEPEVSELSPHVCFARWPGFAQLNPITNRNGYLLDVVRAIFPNVRFCQAYHDEVKSAMESLDKNPQSVVVTFGRHPHLTQYPCAPTPLGSAGFTVVTLRSNPWKYEGAASLRKLRVGLTNSYLDFPMVKELAEDGKKDGRVEVFNQTASPTMLYHRMIEGELDAVIETHHTSYDRLQDMLSAAILERVKRSPCVQTCDVYFRMSNLDTNYVERLTRDYEAGMKRITASGELRRIREYYGFTD